MKGPSPNPRLHEIPEASLRRLPIYYRCLQEMVAAGASQVSCADLARGLGLDPTQVRKDIEMTGIVGKPQGRLSAGRPGPLAGELSRLEPAERRPFWPAPAVWAARCWDMRSSARHGMEIVAAFDIDREKIGQRIHGTEVQPLMFLPGFRAPDAARLWE